MQGFNRNNTRLSQPIQELMELNLRTLENMNYLSPLGKAQFSRPEEFLEHNVTLMIDNGHKLLDYMHELFLLGEAQFLDQTKSMKRKTTNIMRESQTLSEEAMDNTLRTSRKIGKSLRDGKAHRKNSASISAKGKSRSRSKAH